jgi:hypothetical protein
LILAAVVGGGERGCAGMATGGSSLQAVAVEFFRMFRNVLK